MTPTQNRIAAIACRYIAGAGMLVAVLFVFLTGEPALAQSLTVLPVTVQMTPGQLAVSLTIINQGSSETAIQVRAFAWSQSGPDGNEQLTASDAVLASPPLATIAPAAAQVVRLVLRRPPQGKEATYRILLDQIPTPAQPGVVEIALRMSIPIFAEPATRAVPHVQYRVERNAGQAYLVASNDGGRHETLRDVALKTNEGSEVKTETNASPYILAGATRRWRIEQASLPTSGGTLHLTAGGDDGDIDQPVWVAGF